MDHGFVKLYAGTLIQRESDWLIVSAIGGGSWAMQAMTAPHADGPYSHPALVLWPQSNVYHPAPTEPYPAFKTGGYVYAPFTSVATNRGYQVMYVRALRAGESAQTCERKKERQQPCAAATCSPLCCLLCSRRYRAPLESATDPAAWEVVQSGRSGKSP